MKRVVVVSDMHCGHRAGLTIPAWQYKQTDEAAGHDKWGIIQAATWKWYERTINALKPIDLLVVNGDAIEGKNERQGGTELITSERKNQCEMAEGAINITGARKIRMIRGTGYHVGDDDDWEDIIADSVNAEIGDHEWFDVNGLVLDCKHHVGGSSVPHGRATPIVRESLWSLLWSEQDLQPNSDIIIRSHVHYHTYAMGVTPGTLVMTTPALQSYGSKYGQRRCSGTVNIGLVSFDITSRKEWSWRSHLMDMRCLAAVAEKV